MSTEASFHLAELGKKTPLSARTGLPGYADAARGPPLDPPRLWRTVTLESGRLICARRTRTHTPSHCPRQERQFVSPPLAPGPLFLARFPCFHEGEPGVPLPLRSRQARLERHRRLPPAALAAAPIRPGRTLLRLAEHRPPRFWCAEGGMGSGRVTRRVRTRDSWRRLVLQHPKCPSAHSL